MELNGMILMYFNDGVCARIKADLPDDVPLHIIASMISGTLKGEIEMIVDNETIIRSADDLLRVELLRHGDTYSIELGQQLKGLKVITQ